MQVQWQRVVESCCRNLRIIHKRRHLAGESKAAIQRPANSDYCRIESLEGCVELSGLAVRECICGLKSPQRALIFLDASALVHADTSPKMTERVLGVVLRRGRQTIYCDF
jgi:hypothetical protein